MTERTYSRDEVVDYTGDTTVELVFDEDARFTQDIVDISMLDVLDTQSQDRLDALTGLDCWPPIVIWGTVVVDGGHRVTLAKRLNINSLSAFIFKEATV